MKVLVIGTGEYVMGLMNAATASDKSSYGVILPVLFDMRRRMPDRIESILLAGSRGTQMPLIRQQLNEGLGSRYKNFNVTLEATFPEDHVASDPHAYKKALESLRPGDGVIIFTPDDLHYEMAMEATSRKLHVLLAKPAVKTEAEHVSLMKASHLHQSLVMVDFHKRWDPIYRDARKRIRHLGPVNYFQSFMSQPKSQLKTFQRWAGKSSDISYYLNSHHIDFHVWTMEGLAQPISVTAFASYGIASGSDYGLPSHTEDTITLIVLWRSTTDTNYQGMAHYTASWVAASQAEVHSQQRFHCIAKSGEIQVDQAHRGYQGIQESSPLTSSGLSYYNPLYMSYLPHPETGTFDSQDTYGYQSIQSWLQACLQVNENLARNESVDWQLLHQTLPTLKSTFLVTKILAAGRQSLDQGNKTIFLTFDS